MTSNYNDYKFTSKKALRAALKSMRDLEQFTDDVSATIYLDLSRALGDDPNHPIKLLTSYQRHFVQQYLIDAMPIMEVARLNKVTKRTVYWHIDNALTVLLEFFETNVEPKTKLWKPWMIDLLRDPYLTIDEIAARVGKTHLAVRLAMTRYRTSEGIPFRTVRRRIARRKPE